MVREELPSVRKMGKRRLAAIKKYTANLLGIVGLDGGNTEALHALRRNYHLLGDDVARFAVDLRLSGLQKNNPNVFYNLACSYSIRNGIQAAARMLKLALNLGFRDYDWIMKDPELSALRSDPLFNEIKDIVAKLNAER